MVIKPRFILQMKNMENGPRECIFRVLNSHQPTLINSLDVMKILTPLGPNSSFIFKFPVISRPDNIFSLRRCQ